MSEAHVGLLLEQSQQVWLAGCIMRIANRRLSSSESDAMVVASFDVRGGVLC
jgi:hypothetical protein